jgi:hypothetical protein
MVSVSALAALEPYAEPPKVELTPEQRAKFEKGELVFWEKTEDWADKKYYKEGTAAFRVNASPEKVWKVIGDFSKYPEWAYKVGGTKEYKPSHDDQHYIEFKAEIIGKKYYVAHDFPMAKKGYGTWKTDHSQKSDCVLDTVGFWRVNSVKDHPNQSEVYYSGKVVLSRTCAKGFLGIGGFNGSDMAHQTFEKIKKRV